MSEYTPGTSIYLAMKPTLSSGSFARLLHGENTVSPFAKTGMILAGYTVAAAVAAAAVACHVIVTGGPGAKAYSGMNAFGDCLLFMAIFGVAAVLPTGAALFFLKPCQAFWRAFSVVAPVFALTSLAAFVAVTIDSRSMAAGLAFPRILVAPLFALAFLLAVIFAPNRAARIALLAATAIEATSFACWVITCLLRNVTNAQL